MPATFDPTTHAGPLPSPCIGQCVMTPRTGLCEGCLRTIDEIIAWAAASEADKRAIWLAIDRRRNDAGQRPDRGFADDRDDGDTRDIRDIRDTGP